MRKSTYESRMKSYLGMLIAFGFGMFVIGLVTQLQLDLNNAGTYALQPLAVEITAVAEFEEIDYIDEEVVDIADEGEEYDDGDLNAELDPDDYDGTIVIATADEVITMTIDDDGIKHFTNHMVG